MHKEQAGDGAKGKEVLKFFDWAYKNGARLLLNWTTCPAGFGQAGARFLEEQPQGRSGQGALRCSVRRMPEHPATQKLSLLASGRRSENEQLWSTEHSRRWPF
jgi:hypothetical protein